MKVGSPYTKQLLLSISSCALLIGCGQESSVVTEPVAPVVDAVEETVVEKPAPLSVIAQGAVYTAGEITVPAGFSIDVFHEGVGERARQLTVRDNGDVLVARIDGKLIGLRDTNGDGTADLVEEREVAITSDVEVHENWLWFSDRVSVNKVALDDNLVPQGDIITVVGGYPEERQHAEKTFALDARGNLYVNSGAPANACQQEMRTPESPGMDPCPLLEKFAGVWKYDASKIDQTQDDGELFATGIRNAMALRWSDAQNGLYIANHGRDQLFGLWPEVFTQEQSVELPAEEFHFASEGADLGWPYTYFDPSDNTRYLAPEYGGNGAKTPDKEYQQPLYGFPAHWAPNDMLLVDDPRMPAPFNEGVMIAFHGSWNRAPLPQAGYRVSFVPMTDGKMTGLPINFTLGFPLIEEFISPNDAEHRPMGLAQGPDGAIYVSDSVKGTIWRIAPWTE